MTKPPDNQSVIQGPAPSSGAPPTDDVISLEDLDRILAEDDPQFTSSLGELREKIDPNIANIESLNISEDGMSLESDFIPAETLSERFPKLAFLLEPFYRLRISISTRWIRWKYRATSLFKQTIIFMQTRPKEYWKYGLVVAREYSAILREAWARFQSLSRIEKVGVLVVGILASTTLALILKNFSGAWIPSLWQPPIKDFSGVAQERWSVQGDSREALYRAFPQVDHQYQFRRIVANLRRTNNVMNPMGYFEFYVNLDSEATAVEMRSNENRFHDLLQREIEEFAYAELDSEAGKLRLKSALQKALNGALQQGWVNDIFIRSIVLKP